MKKRILITGAAGFIGFHLSLALKQRGDFCIGLDNFNSYYDVALKKRRAELLAEAGVEVIHGDIRSNIAALLDQYEITHVAHLAAQAGVRYCLTHPHEYVGSNVDGFVSMLEGCKARKPVFVYASSSSVYGLNSKIPFSVEDKTDLPANLYGATKKANELMAHAYHHLYGIPVTGLRYFTVYGPWGRPDMAYYQFSQKMDRNEPITLFNHGKMRRDFTYIDDIVKGTISALDLGAPCEVFNLGNNQPVELLDFVATLEKALGKKAICHYAPMQKEEVIETFADIEKSRKILGFAPKIGIEEGLTLFSRWFREYEKQPVETR